MVKLVVKRARKTGLKPGSLIFVGEKKIETPEVKFIVYNADNLFEYSDENFNRIKNNLDLTNENFTSWIDIVGLHKINNVEDIGDFLDLHPLTLEDILNTDQRPKIEEYQKYFYFVLKMIKYNEITSEIEIEQVSLILGLNYVITFQEQVGDVFDQVRKRLRNKKGRIIKLASDYLAYSIMDAIIDNYFNVLEQLGEELEELEGTVFVNPSTDTIQKIHSFKREMIILRKSIWPLREVISQMIREDNQFIKDQTKIYLRDIYDHTIQIIDTVETYRDLLSGMVDIYLSSKSNQMNEVMKVLTIIATLFIPLTFITGLYGMNFIDMPELHSHYGYFFVWVLMIIVTGGLLYFFKRKDWL